MIFKSAPLLSIMLLLLITIFLPNRVIAQSASLYAGVAEVDITPPIGFEQYGGLNTGVNNPLYAKAVVFQEGNEKAALVICDVIGITREFSSEVRLEVSQQTDIPYENIIVAATHTHTGPVLHTDDGSASRYPNLGFPLEEYVNKKRAGELREEDKDSYVAILLQNVARALKEANDTMIQVNIESGSGKAEKISFNRRFVMKDGKVRFNPGVGNPDIIRPAGPIDPGVGIILLRNASDNEPLAGLINFANHAATVGGTKFSADYPAYLAASLSASLGDDFVSIFGQGASGDLNHVDVVEASHQEGAGTVTQRIGETLASVVKTEMSNLKRSGYPQLSVRSKFIYAPLQQYTEEELRWAQQEERSPLYNQRSFLEFRRMLKIRSLEKMQRTGEAIPPTSGTGPWTLPVEIQVLRIGEDTAIVGLPGEVFVDLGLAIKDASPFETTLVIELTNRHIGYMPTEKAFAQGSYETINSRLAPGGGEMMVETAVRLLNELSEEIERQ